MRPRPRLSVRTRLRPIRTTAPRTALPFARTVTRTVTRRPDLTLRGEGFTLKRVVPAHFGAVAHLAVTPLPGATFTVTRSTPGQAATRSSSAFGADATVPPCTAAAYPLPYLRAGTRTSVSAPAGNDPPPPARLVDQARSNTRLSGSKAQLSGVPPTTCGYGRTIVSSVPFTRL